MDNFASWTATAATIFAACLTASNLGSRITGYGFIIFTIGSVAWFTVGYLTGQPALIWTNAVMTLLNLFGVWRWLGRQAKLEEGAKAAADASEAAPGEKLFPVSLLGNAPMLLNGDQKGSSVDAMVGCRSGRLVYLMASEGGLAGVGERFRRVPWSLVRVENDRLLLTCDRSAFERLELVDRADWTKR